MNTMEVFYIVFVGLTGLAMGSLVVLMLGHLMSEHWLAPVRSEIEATALTLPLLLLLGILLAFGLQQVFPWASGRGDLPPLRAAFLSPVFYLLRSTVYLGICVALAFWLTRTRHVRRASAIGLACLIPVMSLSAYDWVLSREPHWWSSLFGFAFGLSEALAALSIAILVTLLKVEPASPMRLKSLERALLTLALLSVWTWFAQFLIVWLANLPQGAEWYARRSDPESLALVAVSYGLMLAAILVLVPSGVSRIGMIVGSALALLHHGTHFVWILQPKGRPSWIDLGLMVGLVGLWGIALALVMRRRPTYAEEAATEP
ncbi:hypothetical protein [Microvirga lotononidis]|uniref:Uncharacterized protein n=1 Tax=Microvirga lotononidis TaxID=864069 RepID=I4YVS8_9HYPH|nr:hypothetical protein [Microvirga lotononidis]EIM28070.1 hypothetical protein MicloDRAFT_00046480 [Microvirga lotononidis]WQO27821.1 hypothetical protein U0023_01540 [Microvirga lotononidis]